MKRVSALLISGIIVSLFLSSCATRTREIRYEQPPSIEAPRTEASSLLALELIAYTRGERGTASSRKMANTIESGFYPVVIGPGGHEVSFTRYDQGYRTGMIYLRENLEPGVYTLVGFRYVWTRMNDLGRIPENQRYFDGQRVSPWQQREFLPLRQPVPLYLRPGSVQSLGRYILYYEIRESGNDYHQLKNWRYRMSRPDDIHVLRVFKDWYRNNWEKWNARNPQRALR